MNASCGRPRRSGRRTGGRLVLDDLLRRLQYRSLCNRRRRLVREPGIAVVARPSSRRGRRGRHRLVVFAGGRSRSPERGRCGQRSCCHYLSHGHLQGGWARTVEFARVGNACQQAARPAGRSPGDPAVEARTALVENCVLRHARRNPACRPNERGNSPCNALRSCCFCSSPTRRPLLNPAAMRVARKRSMRPPPRTRINAPKPSHGSRATARRRTHRC